MWRRLWLVLVLLAGCKADKGEACTSDPCAASLVCHQAVCVDPATFCRDDPAHAERCGREGRCALEGDRCVAAAEEDCKRSARCEAHGHCTLADGCCSRDGVCPSAEEDPITHVERLADAAQREAAIATIVRLCDSARLADGGDRAGPRSAPLYDDVVPPLAAIAERHQLPVEQQAAVLGLLASSRHPKAAAALVSALERYQLDDGRPTPLDAAMSEVLAAAADMKLAAAAPAVLRLFTGVQASWSKAEIKGMSRSLERAVMALAEHGWTAQLVAMLEPALDAHGDVRAWQNERYRQRIAARALGRIRAPAAIVALLRVLLGPRKGDVADAATEALVAIGKPAAAIIAEVLAGSHQELVAHGVEAHADAAAADVGDVADRSAASVRVEVAARVLATMGSHESEVLAAMAKTDAVGKARIAMALSGFASSAKVIDAFKECYETTPLDLQIDKEHNGVSALMSRAPAFFDQGLTPWIVEGAIALVGTDTALAPFRETAMVATLLIMSHDHADAVAKLGELITREKWASDFDAARALTGRCKTGAACYLEALAAKPDAFVALKAAMMVGVYAGASDADAIQQALLVAPALDVKRTLAMALDHALPQGDAKRADELEATLGAEALGDADIALALGRLRARAL